MQHVLLTMGLRSYLDKEWDVLDGRLGRATDWTELSYGIALLHIGKGALSGLLVPDDFVLRYQYRLNLGVIGQSGILSPVCRALADSVDPGSAWPSRVYKSLHNQGGRHLPIINTNMV